MRGRSEESPRTGQLKPAIAPSPPPFLRQQALPLALAAHARGELATAIRLYHLCLTDNPADGEILHYLGAALLTDGARLQAINLLKRSLYLQFDNGYFHYNYALALRTDGEVVISDQCLQRAIALEPLLLDAYYHLAQLQLAAHAYPAAARALFRASYMQGLTELCLENLHYTQVFHTGEQQARRPVHWPAPPLVSIVIPCVNYGQFVIDAINSCLQQTYPNIEIVLVEGGSNDGRTRQIVEAIRHPRVRTLFRAPIRPVGDNRNFGIGAARGDFICCLDADDKLAPDYIEKTLFCLIDLNYDAVGSGVQTFGSMDARRNFIRQPGLKDFQQTNQLPTAALFRRVWWEKAGGFYDYDRANGFVHEDWNFWFRLAALGARIMNINWEHLIYYRQHGFERLTGKSTILPLPRQIEIITAHNADVLGRPAPHRP